MNPKKILILITDRQRLKMNEKSTRGYMGNKIGNRVGDKKAERYDQGSHMEGRDPRGGTTRLRRGRVAVRVSRHKETKVIETRQCGAVRGGDPLTRFFLAHISFSLCFYMRVMVGHSLSPLCLGLWVLITCLLTSLNFPLCPFNYLLYHLEICFKYGGCQPATVLLLLLLLL